MHFYVIVILFEQRWDWKKQLIYTFDVFNGQNHTYNIEDLMDRFKLTDPLRTAYDHWILYTRSVAPSYNNVHKCNPKCAFNQLALLL